MNARIVENSTDVGVGSLTTEKTFILTAKPRKRKIEMTIRFRLLDNTIDVALHPGINGMHRIVFDETAPYKAQIPLNTSDLDTLISKLQEMRKEIG